MKHKTLNKELHTDPETGFLCRYVRSDTEYFRPHNHDYYEIFMVLKGNVCHIVNEKEQTLTPGQMLFIRDHDIHDYKSADGTPFEFINIAFQKENFVDMTMYVGDKFPTEKLLSSELPPSVFLSEREKEKLFYSMTELWNISDKGVTKIRFRLLLLNLFVKFFFNYNEEENPVPLWLELTVEKMKKPANFTSGAERMYELSGRSREHLCRMLKKYYNTTIHDFVNDLKLEYCLNLLTSSNLSVTEICFKGGFDNLSWFYKMFTKKYGATPLQYRKRLKK